MNARRTLLALVVLESLEASKGSSASKNLVAELGLVGLAVGIDLLVSLVRFSFADVSARLTGVLGMAKLTPTERHFDGRELVCKGGFGMRSMVGAVVPGLKGDGYQRDVSASGNEM